MQTFIEIIIYKEIHDLGQAGLREFHMAKQLF